MSATDNMQQETIDPIVGIDLGTTNSLVAYADAAGPRLLAPSLPSVVRYGVDGRVEAVGAAARANAAEHIGRTVMSVKRLMGRSLVDVAEDAVGLPYEVIKGQHAQARIALPGRREPVSPQEVSAEVLRELRARASAAMGVEVRRAVVTVPAYFDDAQRQATRDAGRIAGLDVVRIVNEPTAAALAYGIGVRARHRATGPETIAVYDLGGGTFDISILKVIPPEGEGDDEGGEAFFQVLATAGDTRLGGDDLDRLIAEWARGQLEEQGAEVPELASLVPAAESAKVQLSSDTHAIIELPGGGELALSREEFERIALPFVDRTAAICDRALAKAKLSAEQIDRVVLVGGATRTPLVRRRVGEVFGSEPYIALDPDQVVALGAAVQASILAGHTTDMLLLDVIPLSLGLETVGGAVAKLITSGSTVPARATERFSTGVDGQTSIKLNIVQGEREMVADCRSLGEFHLRGIPPMPAGIPQLEVEFLVDANGVLSVSAVEQRSGERAELQVVPNHGLTREEVERMETESLEHARDDMTQHRVIDLVVNAELDLKWIGERLDAVAGELEAERVTALRSMMTELRVMITAARADWRAVDANVFAALKQRLDEASMRVHELSIARTLSGASRGRAPADGVR
ncbi:MAG: Hsp70 family protein [Planctomycetota bacterium]